jgi:hypothetical protein
MGREGLGMDSINYASPLIWKAVENPACLVG